MRLPLTPSAVAPGALDRLPCWPWTQGGYRACPETSRFRRTSELRAEFRAVKVDVEVHPIDFLRSMLTLIYSPYELVDQIPCADEEHEGCESNDDLNGYCVFTQDYTNYRRADNTPQLFVE